MTITERRARAAQLRRQGLSLRQIAPDLGCMHATVRLDLTALGLPTSAVKPPGPPPQRWHGTAGLLRRLVRQGLDANALEPAAALVLELLALRWRHIDFADRIVHVMKAFVLGQEDTPKSHRVRSVPLSDQAFVTLDALSRREHFTGPDDLVFCSAVAGTCSTTT